MEGQARYPADGFADVRVSSWSDMAASFG